MALLFAVGLSAQTPVTIYEIQGQTAVSPLENEIVTTSGIVTSLIREDGFFLQDGDGGWNGVYVYYTDETFISNLNRGDEVELIGKVSEYYGKTEITDVVSATVISSGNPVPNPVSLTTNAISDEQYEGVLIQVQNAVCTDTTLGYGEFLVDDGSGACRVDDKLWSYWNDMAPIPDSSYNITGIVDYSFDNFKVLPRDASDLADVQDAIFDAESLEMEMYPNPVSNGVLYLNAECEIDNIIIFNMIGQSVMQKTDIGEFQTEINMEELKQGVYIIRIAGANGKTTSRRIMID
jgi:uncharacterized protein YdeI (BOF family)